MIKTTGAELNAFYNDKTFWKDDMFHEGEVIILNDVEMPEGETNLGELAADDQVSIDGGVIYLDARGDKELGSFEFSFRKWRRQQTTAYFSISAPKDKADAVKAAIKASGGRVIS